MALCGIIFIGNGAEPVDSDGCLLPAGHDGPHEFRAEDGSRVRWETDYGCGCTSCDSDEPDDWCKVYWKVS